MKNNTDIIIISTTVENKAVAQKLAYNIIEQKLATCVQYTFVNSIYRWKGSVESSDEYVLQAKTKSSLKEELINFIRQNHSYELPEIIVTPIIDGYEKYLEWLAVETKDLNNE